MTEREAGAGGNALCDLQWHWGGAHEITGAGERWLARRGDNGRMLTASSPDRLRELIIADYAAQPVKRDCEPGAAS